MSLIKFGNSFLKLGNSLLNFVASRVPEPEPEPDPNTAIIGGRSYRVVEMPDGNTWLAENLDYKFEVDGSQIPIGLSRAPNTPCAWYYDNDEAMYGFDGERKCGLLYNWYAVKYLNDNKDTLIPGWHVPTKDEWVALINAVGADNAGTKLKAQDTDWYTGWNGTDDYGFSALPSGQCWQTLDPFSRLGSDTFFWSATTSKVNSDAAYCARFSASSSAPSNAYVKTVGNSLRLIKDK
jgi:uncharacterized protein (TIGR02145 family)